MPCEKGARIALVKRLPPLAEDELLADEGADTVVVVLLLVFFDLVGALGVSMPTGLPLAVDEVSSLLLMTLFWLLALSAVTLAGLPLTAKAGG